MIYSFTYGIYIFLLTLLSGFLLYKAVVKLWGRTEQNRAPTFFLSLILGIIFISLFTSVVSFFSPINGFVHLFFVLILVGGTLANKKEIMRMFVRYLNWGVQHKIISLLLVLIYIIGISEAAGLPSVGDTGYYHIPLVKWLNSYGLVKGLANLQDSLGFMSGWFYYASLFDLGMFDDLTYHILNALAFTWGWCFVARLYLHFREGTYGASTFLIIPVSIYLGSRIRFIASISPELIVSIIIFWVVCESLSLMGRRSISATQIGSLYLVVVFCIYLKLTAAPVVLFLLGPSVLYLRQQFQNGKHSRGPMLRILTPAVILLGIFMGQNIILSGYPLYPIAAIDIAGVDWKVPKEALRALTSHIKNYGINQQYYDLGLQGFSGVSWITGWFERNLFIKEETIIMVCFLFLPISISYGLLKLTRNKNSSSFFVTINYFTLLAAVVIWFFSSPNPRFGAVWILMAFFFPLSLHLAFNRESSRRYMPVAEIIFVFTLSIWLYFFAVNARLYSRTLGESRYLTTLLLDIYTPEYRQIVIADSTKINISTNEDLPRPWNIPLPSVGQELNYKPQIDTAIMRRGETIAEGFRPAVQHTQ